MVTPRVSTPMLDALRKVGIEHMLRTDWSWESFIFMKRCCYIIGQNYYYSLELRILMKIVERDQSLARKIRHSRRSSDHSLIDDPGKSAFRPQELDRISVTQRVGEFVKDFLTSEPEFALNLVVSALALLSCVYQYLIGYFGVRDSSKMYSAGSLDFRDSYVPIVLYQGSYVWIKFRDVAVYRRSRKDQFGRAVYHGKHEPRFKPAREKTDSGTSLKFNYLPLGGYDTERDAEIAYQIAAFYYGKDEGKVKLEDGSFFDIPPMSEQERSLCGKNKANWVSATVKKVYGDFKSEEIARSNTSGTYSARDIAELLFGDLEDLPAVIIDPHQTPGFDDVLHAFEFEAFGGPTTSPSTGDVAHHGFQRTELLQNPNVLNCQEGSHALAIVSDSLASMSDFNAKQENEIQQLLNLQKEQQEAMFNRQLTEQHQQHLQNLQRLEERILALQRENEDLKSSLHQVVKSLQTHLATSTEI